jgi:hypothetical protein
MLGEPAAQLVADHLLACRFLPRESPCRPLTALSAERTAGGEIASNPLCIVRRRHRENCVDGCTFASAYLSVYPGNSRTCSGSLPTASGFSAPYRDLDGARILAGSHRLGRSTACMVHQRRKSTQRGAHSSDRCATGCTIAQGITASADDGSPRSRRHAIAAGRERRRSRALGFQFLLPSPVLTPVRSTSSSIIIE